MDSVQQARALRATQQARNEKRKSESADVVATPNKKIDTKLDAGQLSRSLRPVQPDRPDEATLSAEIEDLRGQLEKRKEPKKRAQAKKAEISRLEQVLQVYAAASHVSMHDEIAETMRHEDWDEFWQVMITYVITKRRINLTKELPKLLDETWYGENDHLADLMFDLKSGLRYELFNTGRGYSTTIAKLPVEGGFRQAVKDHILARLREEAKDPLLDSIRDPLVATKRDDINSKKLNMDATTNLLEIRDELKMQMSTEDLVANEAEEQANLKHIRELELSIKTYEEKRQTWRHTIEMGPKYDINLLHRIVKKFGTIWSLRGYREKAQKFDYRFQMRLHSFIATINTSSDTMMKHDILALIERCIATERDDIMTVKGS